MVYNETLLAWLTIAFILGIMATITIWARRDTWLRTFSILAFVLSLPISAGMLTQTLGRPTPYIEGLTIPAGDWPVLGLKIVPKQGIYIMLDVGRRPLLAVIPWSNKAGNAASELQENPGGGMMLKVNPFEPSLEDRDPPQLYAKPQPKFLPDKPAETTPPLGSDDFI